MLYDHSMAALPLLHETKLDPRDLITLADVARIDHAPAYAALRSYGTRRRTHPWLQEMPEPVCMIGPSRMWVRTEIESWLEPLARMKRIRSRRAKIKALPGS